MVDTNIFNPLAQASSRALDLDSVVVRCLSIPIAGFKLLLPATSLAEISSVVNTMPTPNSPPWIVGTLAWRGLAIPLISVPVLIGARSTPAEITKEDRIIIFNTLSGTQHAPFFGVISQGIPKLVRVSASMMERVEGSDIDHPIVLEQINLEGEPHMMPNIDHIERLLTDMKF